MSLFLPQIQYFEGWKRLLLMEKKMETGSNMEILTSLHREDTEITGSNPSV
jgi:hypothetical protein